MESFIVRSQPLRESLCRVSQRDAQILRHAIDDGLRFIEQVCVRSFPPDAYFAYVDNYIEEQIKEGWLIKL